jgi:hypothetical protein
MAIGNIPEAKWTWVPIAKTACGNGSETGIGVNPSSKSKSLLVFLKGGGGCWTQSQCSPSCKSPPEPICAANIGGYDQKNFGAVVWQAGNVFDRQSNTNPFRDFDFVFVPYCSGDLHASDAKAAYGTEHRGRANIREILKRLVPTFCDADRVVLAGSSAGGFGTVWNYEQLADAFPGVPVHMIDDSGPPLSKAKMPLQTTMWSAWGAAAFDPKGCAACASGWDAWIPYLANKYPKGRFSLLSPLWDVSIGPVFGAPINTAQSFKAAMNEFADTVIEPLPNARVFFVDEAGHTYLQKPIDKTSDGVTLAEFLGKQISGDSSWKSVRPK